MAVVEVCLCKQYTGTGVSGLEIDLGREIMSVDIRKEANEYHAWKSMSGGSVYFEKYVTGTPNSIEWGQVTPDSSISWSGTKVTINSTHVALNESGKVYMLTITPRGD